MKRFIFNLKVLLLVLFLPIVLWAQNQKNQIENPFEKDSILLAQLMIDIESATDSVVWQKNIDQYIALTNQLKNSKLKSIQQKGKDLALKVDYFTCKGLYQDNQPERRKDCLIALLQRYEKNDLPTWTNDIYSEISRAYQFTKDFYHAELYLNKAINWVSKTNNVEKLKDYYIQYSFLKKELFQYEKSLDWLLKAEKLIGKNKTYEDVDVYFSLGNLYFDLEKTNQAITYYEKADKILKEENFDINNKLEILIGLARAYNELKNYTQAEKYINQAKKLLPKEESLYKALVYNNSGIIALSQKQLEKAIAEYEVSLKTFEFFKSDYGVVNTLISLGHTYIMVDSLRSKSSLDSKQLNINTIQLKKAEQYLLDAKAIAGRINEPKVTQAVYNNLRKLYKTKGDYKNAYNCYAEELIMKDSINNQKSIIKFNEQTIKFEYQKQKELDSIQNANEKQLILAKIEKTKVEKRLLWLGIFTLLLLAGMGFARYKYLRNKNELAIQKQQNLIEKQQKAVIETELELLRAQINPHFLFNVINTIYFKIDKKNNDAREALLGFSEILRYQLYECNVDKVPVEKEIQYIKEYIQLQLLRKPDNTICNLSIAPSVENFMITPLLLIPFIENAFKYLSNHKDQPNNITINLTKQNNSFIFDIDNDYQEVASTVELKNSGIGINNVKRRLELLYPNQHQLEISQNGQQYQVKLTLQLT